MSPTGFFLHYVWSTTTHTSLVAFSWSACPKNAPLHSGLCEALHSRACLLITPVSAVLLQTNSPIGTKALRFHPKWLLCKQSLRFFLPALKFHNSYKLTEPLSQYNLDYRGICISDYLQTMRAQKIWEYSNLHLLGLQLIKSKQVALPENRYFLL